MRSIQKNGDIDINNVAVFQWQIIGNTLTNNFVNRGKDAFGEISCFLTRRLRSRHYRTTLRTISLITWLSSDVRYLTTTT